MTHNFQLAACAEMLWLDKPIDWRAARLREMGFDVGLWYWQPHDHDKLTATGATFTIVNGYLRGPRRWRGPSICPSRATARK